MLVVDKNFFDEAKIPQDVLQAFPSLTLHEIKYLLENYVPDKFVSLCTPAHCMRLTQVCLWRTRSAQEKGIPTSVKRKMDAASQKANAPSSLELDPFATVPSPFAPSPSSSVSSSSDKNRRKGRR